MSFDLTVIINLKQYTDMENDYDLHPLNVPIGSYGKLERNIILFSLSVINIYSIRNLPLINSNLILQEPEKTDNIPTLTTTESDATTTSTTMNDTLSNSVWYKYVYSTYFFPNFTMNKT